MISPASRWTVRNVLRIQHKDSILGPYHHLRMLTIQEGGNLDPLSKSLYEKLGDNEPSRIHNLIPLDRKPMPVMWNNRRPGPREDPFIRDFAMKNMLMCDGKFLFGFMDFQQMRDWLWDDSEIALLMTYGFQVVEYRKVRALVGLRQTIFENPMKPGNKVHSWATILELPVKQPTWKRKIKAG